MAKNEYQRLKNLAKGQKWGKIKGSQTPIFLFVYFVFCFCSCFFVCLFFGVGGDWWLLISLYVE